MRWLVQPVFLLAVLLGASPALAELTVASVPLSAPQCSEIEVTVATNEGHEYATIRYTGLRLLKGQHPFIGWDQSRTPGFTIGATAHEWHMNYQGPPTWTFEVTGEVGTKAEVWVDYIGGSWGMPVRTTAVSEIEITGPAPAVKIEDQKTGSGPGGRLVLDGQSSTLLKLTVKKCQEALPGVTLTVTSTLGLLGSAARPYTKATLEDQSFEYRDEQAKTRIRGVKVTTDEEGVAWITLTAHTPVIRETLNIRDNATRLWSDPDGNDHGVARSAIVKAVGNIKGVTFDDEIEVEHVPGTDYDKVAELYKASVRGNPLRWGLVASYLPIDVISGLIFRGHSLADALTGPVNNIVTLFGLLPVSLKTYTCQQYQSATLYFLDSLRRDPSTAALVDGWDWSPVNSLFGGHKAVVFYKRGTSWEGGKVFDPWWSGEVTVYEDIARDWPLSLFGAGVWIDAGSFKGQYPATSEGLYENTYPRPHFFLGKSEALIVTTHSPIVPLLTTPDGRRSGILSDGTVVGEIPGTTLNRYELESGDVKYGLEVDATEADLTVFGTGDGTFSVTLTRLRGALNPIGAEWRDVAISEGESLTAELTEESVFVPLVRGNGESVWPTGSESFSGVAATLRVKAPGKDSATVKARWRNGGRGIDAVANDIEVMIGDQTFTIPKGAARISKKGKISYKATLPGGVKFKFAYKTKNGALKMRVKKLDLSGVGEGPLLVRCGCGDRGATKEVRLVRKGKKKLVTAKE